MLVTLPNIVKLELHLNKLNRTIAYTSRARFWLSGCKILALRLRHFWVYTPQPLHLIQTLHRGTKFGANISN